MFWELSFKLAMDTRGISNITKDQTSQINIYIIKTQQMMHSRNIKSNTHPVENRWSGSGRRCICGSHTHTHSCALAVVVIISIQPGCVTWRWWHTFSDAEWLWLWRTEHALLTNIYTLLIQIFISRIMAFCTILILETVPQLNSWHCTFI